MKSSHFSPVFPLASSSSLNRMLAQAKAYVVHRKKALALKIWFNGLQWSSWDGLGHIRLLWLEGGWIWWHSLVSLKSDGSSWRAGKGCSKSCDGFSWTTLLELSSSVPSVLIRASATILPKELSSLNSWFNEVIVIHEQTTMWHVNVFFLIRQHYFNNVERRKTNQVILRLHDLTTVLNSLWKLTSET